jgi:hypothetical protein
MKNLLPAIAICLTLGLSACSTLKKGPVSAPIVAVDNTTALPSGTYFILNDDGSALTPWNTGVGENVFLQRFTKSGTQKWDITSHQTKKGVTYTIKLAGTDNLYFQPYYTKNHTPIVNSPGNGSAFKITAAQGAKVWFIKSLLYNGDALRSFVFSPNLPTETRFEASENTGKFLWKFVRAEE